MTNVESSPAKGLRRALQDIRADVCKLVGAFDLRDIFALGGLGMVFYGLAQIYQPAAWIVCGAVLFYIGRPR